MVFSIKTVRLHFLPQPQPMIKSPTLSPVSPCVLCELHHRMEKFWTFNNSTQLYVPNSPCQIMYHLGFVFLNAKVNHRFIVRICNIKSFVSQTTNSAVPGAMITGAIHSTQFWRMLERRKFCIVWLALASVESRLFPAWSGLKISCSVRSLQGQVQLSYKIPVADTRISPRVPFQNLSQPEDTSLYSAFTPVIIHYRDLETDTKGRVGERNRFLPKSVPNLKK